jgi:hypothetical protein
MAEVDGSISRRCGLAWRSSRVKPTLNGTPLTYIAATARHFAQGNTIAIAGKQRGVEANQAETHLSAPSAWRRRCASKCRILEPYGACSAVHSNHMGGDIFSTLGASATVYRYKIAAAAILTPVKTFSMAHADRMETAC